MALTFKYLCNIRYSTRFRILLITGEHDYDKNRFTKLMEQLPIVYDQVKHPNAYGMLKPEKYNSYSAMQKQVAKKEDRLDYLIKSCSFEKYWLTLFRFYTEF